jgi:TPR repeat protein/energy-coupling factor transporter ATP-binding protein EcfA2
MNFLGVAGPELPYPGLRPFGPDESALFFGRKDCVDEMIVRMRDHRFLAVIGTSGSGKSSLVRTGLVHELTTGAMADAEPDWKIADCRPGDTPFASLAGALLAPGPENTGADVDPAQMQALAERLRFAPGALTKWCAEGNLPPDTNLLVIIDQFEELFRYQDMSGQEASEAFVARLIEAAETREAPVYVVITMRSEFLGPCAMIPRLAEEINTGLYLVRRMTRDEMRAAIEGPADYCGFDIEPVLVTRLLNDLARFAPWEGDAAIDRLQLLARRADQLPLMQHVLNRLWRQAKPGPDGDITLRDEDYSRLGDLGTALSTHADEVLDSVAAHRRAAEVIFRALVEGRSIATAVRRPCKLSTLIALTGDHAATVAVIEAFRSRSCNFLTPPASVPLDGDPMIDISHESLIRQWKTLAEWTLKEAAAGKQYEDLLERAKEWQNAGSEDLLLRDDRLRAAQLWWQDDQPSAAWADRYGRDFALTAHFLRTSETFQSTREAAAAKALRSQQIRKYVWPSAAAAGTLGIAALVYALHIYYVNMQAQHNMALEYTQDQIIQKDLNAANADENMGDFHDEIIALQDAAAHGSADADNSLGYDYANGSDGVPQDPERAFVWISKAAHLGSPVAEKNLGKLYDDGAGVAENDPTALSWFEKAWADGGYPDAAYQAGLLLLNSDTIKPDPAQAMAWFQKVVAAHGVNLADAENQIGVLYAYGEGSIKKDYGQADTWLRKAAQDGSAEAAYHLAYRYLNGQGVAPDDGQAMTWFRKAIAGKADDTADAELQIGMLYNAGGGPIKQDYGQAVAWFRQAMQDGSSEAAYHLALRYLNGQGVKTDNAQAMTLFQKAVKGNAADIADAEYQIGQMFENGEGEPQDTGKALDWYRKAAAAGSGDAEYRIAHAYYLGDHEPEDYAQAIDWYQKAIKDAAVSAASAAYNTGFIYLEGGNDVTQDVTSARASFAQALKLAQDDLANNADEPTMVQVAWYQLLNDNPQAALKQLPAAAKLAPQDLAIDEYQAEALLMQGNTDAARTIYLDPNHVNVQDVGNNLSWKANVLDDFGMLQKLGYAIPRQSTGLINQITQAFKS